MSNQLLTTIAGVAVYWDGTKLSFYAGMDIDADGANRMNPKPAYGPGNIGSDYTANAGHPGNWWGVVTDENGEPVVQDGSEGQPSKGFYISTTSYEWPQYGKTDVQRYVDANTVPFVVLPKQLREMIAPLVLGCACQVRPIGSQNPQVGVVADFGPTKSIGECSVAMAKAIGVNPNPRTGGEDTISFYYEIFPGRPAYVNGVEYPLIPA